MDSWTLLVCLRENGTREWEPLDTVTSPMCMLSKSPPNKPTISIPSHRNRVLEVSLEESSAQLDHYKQAARYTCVDCIQHYLP